LKDSFVAVNTKLIVISRISFSEKTEGYGTSPIRPAAHIAAAVYLSALLPNWLNISHAYKSTPRPLEAKK
jgi:hypothetical protein